MEENGKKEQKRMFMKSARIHLIWGLKIYFLAGQKANPKKLLCGL